RLLSSNVGDVNHLFGLYHAVQVGSGVRANEWFTLARITILWRRSMLRNKPKAVTFQEPEIAKFGVANSHSILQHGFKYRLQLAWRRVNATLGRAAAPPVRYSAHASSARGAVAVKSGSCGCAPSRARIREVALVNSTDYSLDGRIRKPERLDETMTR